MKRSKHNLSHYHLTTCDMGQLIPIGCVEALPGDTIQHHANVLVRVSPLVAPVMHHCTARVHHFFVPNRLLWAEGPGDNWEDFITGGPDGMDSSEIPTMSPLAQAKLLPDYLGIPPTSEGKQYNVLPLRAFNMIYNEYYRDQDLITERLENDTSVPQIAWEKDYFTSARPWTQKGPEVTVPVGQNAPIRGQTAIRGLGADSTVFPYTDEVVRETGGETRTYSQAKGITRDNPDGYMFVENDGQNFPNIRADFDADASTAYADLALAEGANINDIRRAFAIQRYQEARARYGSRYTEYLRYLGVNPKDARLQRPEYLGGGQAQVNFSEVLQTSPEIPGQDPISQFGVGDMYGHGIAAMRSNKYRRFIEEHGYIMSLLSVRPKAIYTQGIHRSWLRKHKEDFYQRELEHIGQQEVYTDEVYSDLESGSEVFGYQDRYREYREHPSRVSGEFRDILNYWHMGREFAEPPVLNKSFVDCVPTKRIHNEQTLNALWIMVQHKMIARRLVSKNAAPRIF